MIKTVEPLLENHNFKKYDIKTLNLLFSLLKCPKGKSRDRNMLDFILRTVLSKENFHKVFKPFKRESNSIYIMVDKRTKLKIDKNL